MKPTAESKAGLEPARKTTAAVASPKHASVYEKLRPIGLWNRASVQIKFLVTVIPVIVVAVLVVFAVLHSQSYKDARRALEQDQKRVALSQSLLLSFPMKHSDTVAIRRLLSTIIAHRSFSGAAVLEPDGAIKVAVGDPVFGGDPSFIVSQPIAFVDAASGLPGLENLGTLVIRATDEPIRTAEAEAFRTLAFVLVTLVLGLAGGLQLAYRAAVGRRLEGMVHSIRKGRADEKPSPLDVSCSDDLGVLAHTLNDHMRLTWDQRELLAQANATLEQKIAERTGELTAALNRETSTRAELERIALVDSLTDLPNRREFTNQLKAMVVSRGGNPFWVMLIDLDRFKIVNDTLGHPAGDAMLLEVGLRLKTVLRVSDTLARLGGDEFAVLVRGRCTEADVLQLAQDLVSCVSTPIDLSGTVVYSGASVGISGFPDDGRTAKDLMITADLALYRAKTDGRGQYCRFDEAMRDAQMRADEIETALRRTLEDGGLDIHYQPQFCMTSGQLVGLEALLRWSDPVIGQVSPGEFLPVAEDRGLVFQISRFVFERVIADVEAWIAAGLDPGTVAINLHPLEVLQIDEIRDRVTLIEASSLDYSRFVFEVTEDCIMGRGADAALACLTELRHKGLRLSLDDFGTGYASLKHLRDLPVDEIKIDRSFTLDIDTDRGAMSIVSAIIYLADELGLRVVVEGIETKTQQELLRPFVAIVGQGFGLGRPDSQEATTALLQTLSTDVPDGQNCPITYRMQGRG